MRLRVVRIGLAVSLAAVAAGVAGPHWVMSSVLRDVSRVAVAPAHAAATAGLPGSVGVGTAHDRAAAADAALAPAVLLSLALLCCVLFTRKPRAVSRAAPAGGSRAPPRLRF